MEIPTFKSRKELFEFLVTNKETLIAQKKAEVKHADGVPFINSIHMPKSPMGVKSDTNKAEGDQAQAKVTAIINTTNLMDSHKDVHISGLWSKSLQENKMIMHLQEHTMSFDKIIADGDDLKAYTKEYTWAELGFGMQGKTEALVFESTVKADRNAYMLNQYRQGNVKNHSVGMQYVRLVLAVNDDSYGAEYEAWEKYFPMVANKEQAEAVGYFWAVKEAKVIEGSAVPLGSNYATPTIDIKGSPSEDTNPAKDNAADKCTLSEFRQLFRNELKNI